MIDWHIAGGTVVLEWDRAPHAHICRLTDSDGSFDWRESGGLVDPGDDDRTGDILLTSTMVNGMPTRLSYTFG